MFLRFYLEGDYLIIWLYVICDDVTSDNVASALLVDLLSFIYFCFKVAIIIPTIPSPNITHLYVAFLKYIIVPLVAINDGMIAW